MDDQELEVPETENPDDEEWAHDAIDTALGELVDKVAGENPTDENLEVLSDLVFDVIEDLVNDEAIEEMPTDDASDEEKQKWLDGSLSKIEAALKKANTEDDSPKKD